MITIWRVDDRVIVIEYQFMERFFFCSYWQIRHLAIVNLWSKSKGNEGNSETYCFYLPTPTLGNWKQVFSRLSLELAPQIPSCGCELIIRENYLMPPRAVSVAITRPLFCSYLFIVQLPPHFCRHPTLLMIS